MGVPLLQEPLSLRVKVCPQSAQSELQPDAEPDLGSGAGQSRPMSVTGPEEPIDPASVPLPDEADDLIAEHDTQDFWERKEDCLIRHHVIPRLRLFMPSDSVTCPWPLEDLGIRITKGVFRDKNVFQDQEPWWDNVHAHRYLTRYLDRHHHLHEEQTTKIN